MASAALTLGLFLSGQAATLKMAYDADADPVPLDLHEQLSSRLTRFLPHRGVSIRSGHYY